MADHSTKDDAAAPKSFDPFAPPAPPAVAPASKTDPFSTPKADPPPPSGEDAPVPSMAMTKAELLDRLQERAADLTKAEILDVLRYADEGENGGDRSTNLDATAAPSATAPLDTEKRSATIDGVTYTWTAADEMSVPQAARDIWAQAKVAGGL